MDWVVSPSLVFKLAIDLFFEQYIQKFKSYDLDNYGSSDLFYADGQSKLSW